MSGFFSDVERDCVVASREQVAAAVVVLELVAANGRELPPWDAGSHIDLLLPAPDGTVWERQYSLCGDPSDRSRYRVAVLREPEGRGGSDLVHDSLPVGAPVRLRGPRNHFAFEPAADAPVVLLAGGIGVTPLLAMGRVAAEAGRPVTVHYCGRSRSTMAFLDELTARHGSGLTVHAADEGGRLDVEALVAGWPDGVQAYVCGPVGLVDAVEQAFAARSEDPGTLHVEHFEALEFGPPLRSEPFEVELALTGVTVEVGLDRSVLDAVEEQGVLVVSSCRKGTCGTCETPVLDGEIEHRDSVLTPDEQDGGDTMMICVSRCLSDRLVLDL